MLNKFLAGIKPFLDGSWVICFGNEKKYNPSLSSPPIIQYTLFCSQVIMSADARLFAVTMNYATNHGRSLLNLKHRLTNPQKELFLVIKVKQRSQQQRQQSCCCCCSLESAVKLPCRSHEFSRPLYQQLCSHGPTVNWLVMVWLLVGGWLLLSEWV